MNARPEFLYLGCEASIEQELAARAGLPFQAIRAGGLRGKMPWTVLWNGVQIVAGFLQASRVMRQFRPRAILVTGGYVSVPVVLAGSAAHVPVLIYLPDIVPGLAIRRLARWASRIAVSFEEARSYFEPDKAVVTGYPVRAELFHVDRTEARRKFGLAHGGRVTVMVFGGSRGARHINQAVTENLETWLRDCQLIHVSGPADFPQAQAAQQQLPEDLRSRYHPYAYLHDEMSQALAAADLVVARAGASTLGEFPAVGLPAVLVPYPYSGQHQDANADYLVSRGAAVKIADADLERDLLPTVAGLLHDPARLQQMRAHAQALSQPEAAARIAGELVRLAAG